MVEDGDDLTLVPIVRDDGFDSSIAQHFGKAVQFALIYGDGTINIINNDFDHDDPDMTPVEQILDQYNVTRVVAYHIGRKAQMEFRKHGVKLLKAIDKTIGELIQMVDQLEPITESDVFH